MLYWLLDRLRANWEAFASMGAAALAWLCWPNSERRVSEVQKAAEAVHQQVTRMAIEQGTAAAHMQVQRTYSQEMETLKADDALKAASLMADPAALARHIVQVTGSGKFPGGDAPPPDAPAP